MHLPALIRALSDNGRVTVSRSPSISEEALRETDHLLRELEAQQRLEFPGDPPRFLTPAGLWGAVMFYRACQALVYRDLDASWIAEFLEPKHPGPPSPEAQYSVDLTFRFLPDLWRQARAAAENDPLAQRIGCWMNAFPLSSVGAAGAAPADLDALVSHPGLLQLYVDRIIERRDLSRLADDRVRRQVLRAVGPFAELAPEIQARLREAEETAAPAASSP